MVRAVTLNLVEHAMKYEINRNKLKESVSKKKIKDNLKETMNQKLIHLPSKNIFFRCSSSSCGHYLMKFAFD